MKVIQSVLWLIASLAIVTINAAESSDDPADSAPEQADVVAEETTTQTNKNWGILGMNVRGNKESPMSLNIVPWRSADHQQLDPEVRPGWQPKLVLLQPGAYRREVNAFLRARAKRTK